MSFSRSVIGSSRRIANAFVTPRYASRSSTGDHHAAELVGSVDEVLGKGNAAQSDFQSVAQPLLLEQRLRGRSARVIHHRRIHVQ